MSDIKISVIIPVYNSEKYLRHCLDSALNQSFSEGYEVIASVNGSTDNSLKILNEYKEKYPHLVILYKKENIGAALARIEGIKIAKGDYIAFLDSDDYYHKDFLKIMYEQIIKGYDIVGCNYYYRYKKRSIRNVLASFRIFNSVQATRALLIDASMRGYMWNKLYKKSLFTEIKMLYPKKPGTLFEDVVTLYNILLHIKTFKCILKPLYYYRKNHSSVTSVPNPERFNQHLCAFAFIRYLCDQQNNKGYLKAFRLTYLRSKLSLYYDASTLKNQFGHSARKHLLSFKRELSLLRNKKPLPVKGEVWEQYIDDCLS